MKSRQDTPYFRGFLDGMRKRPTASKSDEYQRGYADGRRENAMGEQRTVRSIALDDPLIACLLGFLLPAILVGLIFYWLGVLALWLMSWAGSGDAA